MTLNGQSKVTLNTPLSRISRLSNNGTTEFVGNIYVYQDSAITAGVPNNLTLAHMVVNGTNSENRSRKAATTFSNEDYFICNEVSAGVTRSVNAIVDMVFEVREPGGVFVPRTQFTASQTPAIVGVKPYLIVPRNSDVRMAARTTANNTGVIASFSGS